MNLRSVSLPRRRAEFVPRMPFLICFVNQRLCDCPVAGVMDVASKIRF